MNKHAFVDLAEVQKETKTLYCCGLDPHHFPGSIAGNSAVYFEALDKEEKANMWDSVHPFYYELVRHTNPGMNTKTLENLVTTLATVECYLLKVINIMVKKCNIRVFKLQAGFYEQFGPYGMIMLSRIKQYMRDLERIHGRIIAILDCKRGDIATTQTAYFLGIMGNLLESWGIDYAPFDFNIMNVTPWMGEDVLALGDEQNPGIGLKLMQNGKGIIVVNKTSNPSGPQYQELASEGRTVQMHNVKDLSQVSEKYDLSYDGLSNIGLVVGSTHVCDGSIREMFPGTTLLVPGFGAQGGKFANIIQELIPGEGKWAGQGAIFSSSRGSMYAWDKKLGGSGDIKNMESDTINAVTNFRVAEKAAFDEPGLKEKGIIYPF